MSAVGPVRGSSEPQMAVVPETRDNYHFEDPDHHHTNEDRLFLQLRKVRGRRSSGTPQPSLAPLSAVPHSDALICLAGDYTHVCWPPPMPPTASGSMDERACEGKVRHFGGVFTFRDQCAKPRIHDWGRKSHPSARDFFKDFGFMAPENQFSLWPAGPTGYPWAGS